MGGGHGRLQGCCSPPPCSAASCSTCPAPHQCCSRIWPHFNFHHCQSLVHIYSLSMSSLLSQVNQNLFWAACSPQELASPREMWGGGTSKAKVFWEQTDSYSNRNVNSEDIRDPKACFLHTWFSFHCTPAGCCCELKVMELHQEGWGRHMTIIKSHSKDWV